MSSSKHNAGFIQAIVIIVIALAALGYFGYNVADIAKNPLVRSNLAWAWNGVTTVWNSALEKPVNDLWHLLMAGVSSSTKGGETQPLSAIPDEHNPLGTASTLSI